MHAISNSVADALATLERHAPSGGARGEAARFEDDDLLAGQPGRIEKRGGNSRCLAGPWGRDEDQTRGRSEGALEVGEERVYGKTEQRQGQRIADSG
jgi:hypothetical protein